MLIYQNCQNEYKSIEFFKKRNTVDRVAKASTSKRKQKALSRKNKLFLNSLGLKVKVKKRN